MNKTGDLDLGIALQCCVCRKVPRHGDVELKFMLIIIVKMAVVHYIDHANDPCDIDVDCDTDDLDNFLMIDTMTTNESLEQTQIFDQIMLSGI